MGYEWRWNLKWQTHSRADCVTPSRLVTANQDRYCGPVTSSYHQSKLSAIRHHNMGAADAVLDTYELLEGILICLSPSPRDITKAMRVSKTWFTVISKSTALHNARILAPYDKTKPNKYDRKFNEAFPLYNDRSSIQYRHAHILGHNRGWLGKQETEEDSLFKYVLDIYMANHTVAAPAQIEDSYITTPPCQALSIRLLNFRNYCTVYNREGLRVRDVLNAAHGLWDTTMRYLEPAGEPFNVYLQFQTVWSREH